MSEQDGKQPEEVAAQLRERVQAAVGPQDEHPDPVVEGPIEQFDGERQEAQFTSGKGPTETINNLLHGWEVTGVSPEYVDIHVHQAARLQREKEDLANQVRYLQEQLDTDALDQAREQVRSLQTENRVLNREVQALRNPLTGVQRRRVEAVKTAAAILSRPSSSSMFQGIAGQTPQVIMQDVVAMADWIVTGSTYAVFPPAAEVETVLSDEPIDFLPVPDRITTDPDGYPQH